MATRRDYQESCKVRDREPTPLLGRRPSFDEDEGENWFRSRTAGEDLSDLTMPHLALGRALVEDTNFENTDLSQSLLNWTDFIRVSSARADLRDSDLRSSIFEGCDFTSAVLDAGVVVVELPLDGGRFTTATSMHNGQWVGLLIDINAS
jgi:uncharacterized protein YjbI with pentapeptide repeats